MLSVCRPKHTECVSLPRVHRAPHAVVDLWADVHDDLGWLSKSNARRVLGGANLGLPSCKTCWQVSDEQPFPAHCPGGLHCTESRIIGAWLQRSGTPFTCILSTLALQVYYENRYPKEEQPHYLFQLTFVSGPPIAPADLAFFFGCPVF